MLETQRWLGACGELGVGQVRAGWPGLSPDMAWSKAVRSIFSETILNIATLGTSAQSLRKAAAAYRSVLHVTCVSASLSSLGGFQDSRERGATMATQPGEAELSILGDLC